MSSMGNVFDWAFFWGVFGFLLKTVAPFIMLIIAIVAVGMLLHGVIVAIRSRS
ncbi:PTS ascorbate transporter subunit IIC [Anoxybacillus ayderensis]|uniref:PTS ascorbate transporter subunit IIC n=1 Tax=Anoxybacillus gonensis TaxID=198467 RepID=UPI00109F3AEF|nr:PTS ascorbate transporter subunit IIC [Anoxybacillus gonensis]THD15770.1 PTS ascorbate transporter subunit IIC [Anoxybacillus ayderensis]